MASDGKRVTRRSVVLTCVVLAGCVRFASEDEAGTNQTNQNQTDGESNESGSQNDPTDETDANSEDSIGENVIIQTIIPSSVEVSPTEETALDVLLENKGDRAGTATVEVMIREVTVSEQTVSIGSNVQEWHTLTVESPEVPGDYLVTLRTEQSSRSVSMTVEA